MDAEETEAKQTTAAGDGGSVKAAAPEIAWVMDELRGINADAERGVWQRRHTNEDVRFCIWDGQNDDGRKHSENLSGKPAFPFEGATDGRVRLADFIVNVKSAVLLAAASRAHTKITGMEITDESGAGRIRTLFRWLLRNQWGRRWWAELSKLAQYATGDTPAVGVLGVWWNREMGVRARMIAPADVLQELARRFGGLDEAQVALVMRALADPGQEGAAVELLMELAPGMTEKRAGMVLKEWREGRAAEFPEPYEKENMPKALALRLYYDIFIPGNTGELMDARVIVHREWLSRVQVESRVRTHGYKKSWVKKVLGTEGSGLEGKTGLPMQFRFQKVDGVTELVNLTSAEDYRGLYEVLTVYRKKIRDDGIPGVYRMTVSSGVTDEAGTDEELQEYDHGEYPFVEFTRERLNGRLMDARGVPELAVTDQSFTKLLDDVMGDHAQMSMPPLFVPERKPDGPLLLGPLRKIKRRRQGDYEWFQPPREPTTTAAQRDEIRRRTYEYHGIWHEGVPAAITEILNQAMVDGFLWSLGDALLMVLQLCQQYMRGEQVTRIVGGSGTDIGGGIKEIQGKYDFTLDFDVRTLDSEYVLGLAKALAEYILPWDTSQTVQREKLTRFVLSALNPNLADEVVRPVEEANAAEERDEEVNFALIAAGVEPPILDKGQNFRLRLGVLNEIPAKNPEALGKLSPLSLEILEARVKHLSFMVEQEANAQIGKVGVKKVLGEGIAD